MESPMKKCQFKGESWFMKKCKLKGESRFRSWDELPPELIQGVASRLVVYSDYIRLRAVCAAWRCMLPRFPNHNILRPQVPWLMLTCSSSSDLMLPCSSSTSENKEEDHKLSFFDITENKFHQLNLPSECNGNRVCGSGVSSLGWLLMMGENEGPKVVNLFNPFTRILIPLPPLTTLPQPHIELFFDEDEQVDDFAVRANASEQRSCSLKDVHKFFIKKMVLSASPSEAVNGDDYMVIAILCFGGLGFMKKGDKSWSLYFNIEFNIQEVIFHKGQFYVLDPCGRVGVLDFNSTNDSPKLVRISYDNNSGQLICGDKEYLVEDSSGSLLLVTRSIGYFRKGHQVTRSFNVFKIEEQSGSLSVSKVNSIGGDSIFLGPNSSVCLFIEEGLIRGGGGCQRNCIYFSDTPDTWVHPSTSRFHDLGVFDLEDGSIKPLPIHEQQHPKFCLNHQMPTWVTPNPKSN